MGHTVEHVSLWKQGGNWMASWYNDVYNAIIEKQLHWSISSKKDAIEWCKGQFGQSINISF